jgi:broad specificity phosphatase PhoE
VGQVLLVRHGQASWGAADYDVLSPLGERQATATGTFLAQLRPDAVVHGLMRRQHRTAQLMAEAAGWSLDPSVDGRWDEMDHLAVLDAQPPDFDGEPDAHQFQAWFEKATGRWLSGAHDGEYAESWPEFRERVLAGLDALGDGTTVVVTSGGPISVVVAHLLESSAACASGSTRSTTGRTSPAATSGQTCSTVEATIAAFSAGGRARSMVPSRAPLLRISSPMSSSALVPPCIPMITSRPSVASALTFRARYDAPMLSSTTSAPCPSVAASTCSTKSCSW